MVSQSGVMVGQSVETIKHSG